MLQCGTWPFPGVQTSWSVTEVADPALVPAGWSYFPWTWTSWYAGPFSAGELCSPRGTLAAGCWRWPHLIGLLVLQFSDPFSLSLIHTHIQCEPIIKYSGVKNTVVQNVSSIQPNIWKVSNGSKCLNISTALISCKQWEYLRKILVQTINNVYGLF